MTIENVVVYCKLINSGTGNLTGYVAGVDYSGGYGVPNATVYATSTNEVNVTDISSAEYVPVVFNFTAFAVYANTNYSFYVTITHIDTPSDSKGVKFELDNGGAGVNGNWVGYTNSAWTYSSSTFVYYVYLEGEYDAEEDVNPYLPDGDVGTSDQLMTGVVWWFVYLVVMLVPAFLLGFVFKLGTWGYLIGLGVGAGLGYAFIPNFPLWMLVLVAVGEVGFAYQTVSRSG